MSRFDRLTLLESFVRIAERGSISSASADLGLSQPAVSRQLIELERQLGTELIRRTTHSLTLTEEGEVLMSEARDLIRGWEKIGERIAGDQDLSGPVRVVAPIALGQRHAIQGAVAFQKDHPNVTVSWTLTDAAIRFDEEGCDCWIKVGDVPDDRLVVRTVGYVERLVVGAPDFTDRVDTDLSALPWVTLSPFEGQKIVLFDAAGQEQSFRANARMVTNSIHAQTEAVLSGIGAAILPRWFVQDDLSAGRLIALSSTHSARSLPVSIACVATRARPKRVDAFLQAMTSWLQGSMPLVAGAEQKNR